MADTIKISANLPDSTVAQLKWIASERGTSLTEVLRRAVEHEAYFLDQTSQGTKILTEDTQGKIRQVVMK